MKNLDGNKVKIKDLLSREYFYRVPEYQRPFSWDGENFQDLIQDLVDAERNQEYFMGTIVLHKKDKINDIVDGQQRLTTLMILFACLRDLINDRNFKDSIQEKIRQKENIVDGIPEKIRIEVKDREVFNQIVATENGTVDIAEKERLPEPQWRYVKAVEVFRDKLKLFSQDELKKFIQFLSQNCILIFLSTTTFDDAFKLFTIVNDRGKQLRRIDILKAQNIAPDVIKSDSIRNSLAQKWEDAEKNLGETTFESVLFLLRFILLEEKPYKDLLTEFEEKIFSKGLLQKGEQFVDTVCEYAQLYNDVFDDLTYFDSFANKNRIISLIYIMNIEFKSNEWKAAILRYLSKYNKVNFEHFLSLLEMKYLEGWLSELNKDGRTTVMGNIIKAINSSKNSNDVLSSNYLKSDTDRLGTLLDRDIYGRTYCKYILLRLELLTTEHDVEKKFEAKSIEHVLPQNPDPASKWPTLFNRVDQTFWEDKLANLVLLSKSKNSSAKNYDFDEKKKRYLGSRVSDYPRSVQILGYPIWTPEVLSARQKELLKLATTDIFK